MNRRIAAFYERHQQWTVPVAFVAFLASGWQAGYYQAVAQLTTKHNDEIKQLQDKITDKDTRLRAFNDKQHVDQKDLVASVKGVADSAAKSAAAAADAAKAATDAAKSAAQIKETEK